MCDKNAVAEMLSNKKYTPVSAISQSKLIFGTNNSNIPIVVIKAPKNMHQTTFVAYPLFIIDVTIL